MDTVSGVLASTVCWCLAPWSVGFWVCLCVCMSVCLCTQHIVALWAELPKTLFSLCNATFSLCNLLPTSFIPPFLSFPLPFLIPLPLHHYTLPPSPPPPEIQPECSRSDLAHPFWPSNSLVRQSSVHPEGGLMGPGDRDKEEE